VARHRIICIGRDDILIPSALLFKWTFLGL